MKSYPIITNLKDLVSIYGVCKSDLEIAYLLDINIKDIESVKKELTEDECLEENVI